MRYICLGYLGRGKWEALPTGERSAVVDQRSAYDDELRKSGCLAWCEALQPADNAVTLQWNGGDVAVSDGPCAATPEQLAGILLLEANDLNHAIRLVSRHPGMRLGVTFEIRPVCSTMKASATREAIPRHGLRRRFSVKYMLLIYGDEQAWTDEERQSCYVESTQLTHELQAAGKFVSAAPLQPVATATCVRVREGRRSVTDGPFAETREQLGGYFMIEAEDLDEALSIASRIPAASKGAVEVRPVVELTGLAEGA